MANFISMSKSFESWLMFIFCTFFKTKKGDNSIIIKASAVSWTLTPCIYVFSPTSFGITISQPITSNTMTKSLLVWLLVCYDLVMSDNYIIYYIIYKEKCIYTLVTSRLESVLDLFHKIQFLVFFSKNHRISSIIII